MQLYEKYRPKTWGEVVGQDTAIATIKSTRDFGGLAGNAFWISGKSGTGKTTIARLIAAEVADEFNTTEMDAGDLTTERVREIALDQRYMGIGKSGGHAFIINEAHGLRAAIVRRLQCLLEPIPSHVVWCFTTTIVGELQLFENTDDASAFRSRCKTVELSQRGLAKPFARHVKQIAEKEGLDGQPIEKYIKLANRHQSNMRAMFQAVEAGGKLL